MTVSKKQPDRSTLIGSKIRQLRKDRNLTQAYLADRVGIQQSDLCRMENGEYRVSLDVLFRILMEFKMSMSEFFQDSPIQVPPGQSMAPIQDSLSLGPPTQVLFSVKTMSQQAPAGGEPAQ